MFTATAPSFRMTATAFAASLLGTALVFAIPQAAQAAPKPDNFVQKVESQIVSYRPLAAGGNGVATIAVNIDANGKVRNMELVESTGDKSLDRDAIAATREINWPAGKARSVGVVLTYGDVKAPAKIVSQAIIGRYTNAKGEALASQSSASPTG